MNPVKAGITKKESDYEFSSYNFYLNKRKMVHSNIYKIIFNSKNNYLEEFNSIKYDSLNLEKEKMEIKDILIKFTKENNVKVEEIRKNDILIKKFISYLIFNEIEFTKQNLANALNIARASLYRKIKN